MESPATLSMNRVPWPTIVRGSRNSSSTARPRPADAARSRQQTTNKRSKRPDHLSVIRLLTCDYLAVGQDFNLRPLGYEHSVAGFNTARHPIWLSTTVWHIWSGCAHRHSRVCAVRTKDRCPEWLSGRITLQRTQALAETTAQVAESGALSRTRGYATSESACMVIWSDAEADIGVASRGAAAESGYVGEPDRWLWRLRLS
jgi:hypothetical protein